MKRGDTLSATAVEERDAILKRLHMRVGVCGHCGKTTCPDKGYSVLPNRVRIDDVLAAINDEEQP